MEPFTTNRFAAPCYSQKATGAPQGTIVVGAVTTARGDHRVIREKAASSCLAGTKAFIQEGQDGYQTFISVGPVIGLVSCAEAKVMVECSRSDRVKIYLTDSDGRQYGMAMDVIGNRPATFSFQHLTPGTYYRVSSDVPMPGVIKSGFRTPEKNWSGVNIALLGTNCLSFYRRHLTDDHGDLLKQVTKLATARVTDYQIHTGSLITLDDPRGCNTYHRCLKLLANCSPSEFCLHKEQILSMIRSEWRAVLTVPTLRHALANCPNIFTLGLGCLGGSDLPLTRDLTSRRYYVATLAYQVYNEYIKPLYEIYTPTGYEELEAVAQGHHFHVLGKVGVIVIDSLGARLFHKSQGREADRSILGRNQWADLRFALGDGGYLSSVKQLLTVSERPLCGTADLVKIGKGITDSLWKDNAAEAEDLLSHLTRWREAKKGRDVRLLAESPDFSAITHIHDDRALKNIAQVVVSNTSSYPVTGFDKLEGRMTGAMTQNLDVHITYKHHDMSTKRSIAFIHWCESKDSKGACELFSRPEMEVLRKLTRKVECLTGDQASMEVTLLKATQRAKKVSNVVVNPLAVSPRRNRMACQ